jgi:hypothetical protein
MKKSGLLLQSDEWLIQTESIDKIGFATDST